MSIVSSKISRERRIASRELSASSFSSDNDTRWLALCVHSLSFASLHRPPLLQLRRERLQLLKASSSTVAPSPSAPYHNAYATHAPQHLRRTYFPCTIGNSALSISPRGPQHHNASQIAIHTARCLHKDGRRCAGTDNIRRHCNLNELDNHILVDMGRVGGLPESDHLPGAGGG